MLRVILIQAPPALHCIIQSKKMHWKAKRGHGIFRRAPKRGHAEITSIHQSSILVIHRHFLSSGIALPWQDWGYEVCALCVNGQEVLERLEECRPDVVLSDIRMPGIDGVELMQRAADRLLCDRKGGSGHRGIFPRKSPGRAAGSGVIKNFAAKKNSAPHRSSVRSAVCLSGGAFPLTGPLAHRQKLPPAPSVPSHCAEYSNTSTVCIVNSGTVSVTPSPFCTKGSSFSCGKAVTRTTVSGMRSSTFVSYCGTRSSITSTDPRRCGAPYNRCRQYRSLSGCLPNDIRPALGKLTFTTGCGQTSFSKASKYRRWYSEPNRL
ncbi:hypothetical protein B5F36_07695 [Anaerofilum sp. An201]|nr:hypothetical protein B5F36_07695 [Anaerofilum sp. An201]